MLTRKGGPHMSTFCLSVIGVLEAKLWRHGGHLPHPPLRQTTFRQCEESTRLRPVHEPFMETHSGEGLDKTQIADKVEA